MGVGGVKKIYKRGHHYIIFNLLNLSSSDSITLHREQPFKTMGGLEFFVEIEGASVEFLARLNYGNWLNVP